MWIYPRGNPTVKVVPLPGRLCTSIVPPCASAIHLQIARPRPVPARSLVRVRAESARQKRSNTCGKSPGAIPMPVSATVKTARPLLLPSSTETWPPRGVCLSSGGAFFCRRFRYSGPPAFGPVPDLPSPPPSLELPRARVATAWLGGESTILEQGN